MRVLDAEEAGLLLEAAAETPFYALIYLALATGARIGELLALRWRDIDLDRASLHVSRTARRVTGKGIAYSEPKTHRSRRPVALSPETVQVLREHRRAQAERRLELGPVYADNGLVFASPTGHPLDDSNLRRAFGRIVAEAGLPRLRFHDLRHTAATLMLQAGVHPKVVSERLGHATVGITLDTYSRTPTSCRTYSRMPLRPWTVFSDRRSGGRRRREVRMLVANSSPNGRRTPPAAAAQDRFRI
jgi:integrase